MENKEIDTSINFKFDSSEYKIAINYFNCTLNNIIDSPELKASWLRILQLFFYSNMIDDKKYKVLNNKVLTYLYTGKLNQNLEKTKKGGTNVLDQENIFLNLSTSETEEIFKNQIKQNEHLSNKRNFFLKFYKGYLSFVLNRLGKDGTISKIIVFEAPPYKDENNVSHFFLNGKIYYTCVVDQGKETAKDDDVNNGMIANFSNLFNKEELNWVIKTEKRKNKKTGTTTERKVTIEEAIKETILRMQNYIATDIVYTDLVLMPLYIDSDLRKAWSSHESFNFGTECTRRQLPEILFEWSIKYLEHSLKELHLNEHNAEKNRLFSKNCLIAIGTPLNTSVSIFEYFTSHNFLLETTNWTDITRLNSPTAHLKIKKIGVTFPLYKSNVIGGNNGPESVLIKNAFNLLD